MGAWSGVMMVGDLTMRQVSIPWPHDEFQQGRAQLLQAWLGPFDMTGANLYGWPTGPTHPHALQRTNAMLDVIVRELVFSRTGPRFLMGDLNHPKDKLPALQLMEAQGWVEVQTWGHLQNLWTPRPTCKSATTIDYVWVSPELTPFLKSVRMWDLFADHSVLGVELDLPVETGPILSWPLPARVEWQKVAWDKWSTLPCHPPDVSQLDINSAYQTIWSTYEESFDKCYDAPHQKLPPQHCGRSLRTQPTVRQHALPLLKPSRPGELTQSNDLLLGREIQHWFRQLRRLQSLKHALRAMKMTLDAQIYRAELWHSIKAARGFDQGFVMWWTQRPLQMPHSPEFIPIQVPSLEQLLLIFDDFELNFRRFESWHAKQRFVKLDAVLQCQSEKLFAMIKPDVKQPLTVLEDTTHFQILGTDNDQGLIQLDSVPSISTHTACTIDGFPVKVVAQDQDVVTIDHDWLFGQMTEFTTTDTATTPQAILEQLEGFWQKRWWKVNPPSDSDWTRVFAFAEAYLPHHTMDYHPINVEQWVEVNKRYTPKSARGLDGVDSGDLQWMPNSLKEALVDVLNRCETVGEWPQSLLHGSVYPLPKREQGKQVGDFRPVILYSKVYRSWSSLRSPQCLRFLTRYTDDHQYGFIPSREAAEMWLMVQAVVEYCILTSQDQMGFVTDIVKAFEALPRAPIHKLALRMGLPAPVMELWKAFLENTSRRFCVGNVMGNGILRLP